MIHIPGDEGKGESFVTINSPSDCKNTSEWLAVGKFSKADNDA